MRIKRIFLAVFVLFAFTVSALAQATNVVTNALPVVGSQALPVSKAQFWTLFISAATPLLVGFVYKIMPKVPKLLVPLATPLVGVGLGLLLNWLQKANLGWVDMAQAGALAVFVREVVDQASKTALVQTMLGNGPPGPSAAPPAA